MDNKLKQTKNEVFIEGILSENNLKTISYTNKKTGMETEAISGNIKVRVELESGETLEVPVYAFTNKYTKSGAISKPYESLLNAAENLVSIAAGGIEKADAIRIGGGQLKENAFFEKGGTKIISTPRINAAFINSISKTELKPTATGNFDVFVKNLMEEVDKEDDLTGRMVIEAAIVTYNGDVDVVKMYTNSEKAAQVVSKWTPGDTVAVKADLDFSSVTIVEKEVIELDFGDPQVTEKSKTTNKNDIILKGASKPFEEELAINVDLMKEALARRISIIESKKGSSVANARNTPAAGINPGF